MNNLDNCNAKLKAYNLNAIKLIGTVTGFAVFSHEITRKNDAGSLHIIFRRFTLEVPRLSSASDFLEIIIPEDTWLEAFNGQEYEPKEDTPKAVVEISGRLQSHNCTDSETGSNRLDLFVFAKEIRRLDKPALGKDESLNEVTLEGFICKEPVIRQTPHGRTITDLFIAVNRRSGSAYIPIIVWGGNAVNALCLKTGDKVRLTGRFQSREYKKAINGTMTTQLVHELSASKVKLIESDISHN